MARPLFCFLGCILLWLLSLPASAQPPFDLLIKGGHVIDPKNQIDAAMDVAIAQGKIARVARDIPPEQAATVVNASGLYVVPGLIDIHAHVFHGTEPNAAYSNSFNALPPDGFAFRVGVTTVVDVGGAGWRNFLKFKEQVIDRSQTRVFAFLNIVGSGMGGDPVEQNLSDMDPKLTAMRIKQHPDLILGVKVAHYRGAEWEPVVRAVEAGRQANVPVMVDFGRAEPPLPLEELFLKRLRPGDIFTHTYGGVQGRETVLENGKVRPFVFEAQKRGIIFDVGHGGGSFLFRQAAPAIRQGFLPNSISTDLHTGSMNAGMKDMLNVMSKFLNLGLSIQDVVVRSTWNPAQEIKRPDLGHLGIGSIADVAVLGLRRGEFGFVDVGGEKMTGTQKLECELTVRAGKVVWDLNGLSRPAFINQH